MMNKLSKIKPLIGIASLLIATCLFGQNCSLAMNKAPVGGRASCGEPCAAPKCKPKSCPPPCPQPCPPTQICPSACPNPCCPPWPTPVLNAAYNYPARIQTRCPWDIFFDVSFIYWQPIQENMEVAFLNKTVPALGTSLCSVGIDGQLINMQFQYKPGFKIGLGGNFDYDNWDTHAEYTWFHNTQKQRTGTPGGESQLLTTWGAPRNCFSTYGGDTENAYGSAEEEWQLHLDIIDLDIGRWGYYGTQLTLRPNFGARAAFIHQKAALTYINDGFLGIGTAATLEVNEKAKSWGIGPKLGIDSNWNLGAGFRMFGSAEGDILFTKYTTLSLDQAYKGAGLPGDVIVNQKKLVALRTHLDLEMGLGWGTYIDCNHWYLDFSASYGFQVFFDQNMFRFWTQSADFGTRSITPMGNLYIQGLTATARLDF